MTRMSKLPKAFAANSRITVEAIVYNEDGHLLLVRQGKHRAGQWELPGGKVKAGESVAQAVRREVLEETGVMVEPLSVLNVYYIEEEQNHDFVMWCGIETTEQFPCPKQPEIAEAKWAMLKFLPTPMAKFTADLIAGARQQSTYVRVINIHSKDWLGE